MNILSCEIFDTTWYALTRRYQGENRAKIAFARLMKAGERREGALRIGCYRHGSSNEPQNLVTVVGTDRDKVEFSGHVLGGEEVTLEGEVYTALVMRRIRKLAELNEQEAPDGVYSYPHPGGVALDQFGEEKP